MPRYQQASAYDIITGGDPSPRPPRQQQQQQQQEPQQNETPQRHRQSLGASTATFKQSTMGPPPSRPDAGNEDLRAQLRTLQYELDSLKQERELVLQGAQLGSQVFVSGVWARGRRAHGRLLEGRG
jgi:hypothetical protein